MFKVIIAGCRDFDNYDLLKSTCDHMLKNKVDIEIVSGGASGADYLGERYANEMNYDLNKFPADWNKYGVTAGQIRNKQMAEYADALIAFWDSKSKGTKNMIDIAKKLNLKIKLIKF